MNQFKSNSKTWTECRKQFVIPEGADRDEAAYLCGHSLGLQPRNTMSEVTAIIEQWGRLGVKGHFKGETPWISYTDTIESNLGQIVGAKADEIAVLNTLTLNIHLLLTSFYQPEGERRKIVLEATCFPSDRYAVVSYLKHLGLDPDDHILFWEPRDFILYMDDLTALLKRHQHEVALLFLGGLNYLSGQFLNIPEIVELASESGIVVGLDLAHAAGNVPLALHAWQVDFAVFCTYKYLNGGPGSLGAIFVHQKHHKVEIPRLEGWWGNDISNRFEMLPEFTPAPGVQAWKLSNPPVIAMASLKCSLELFAAEGMEKISNRSRDLTAQLEQSLKLLDTELFRILTPSSASDRGAMLSLHVLQKGKDIFDHLTDEDIVVDYRSPDIIRVAPCPMYNLEDDLHQFCTVFSDALRIISA